MMVFLAPEVTAAPEPIPKKGCGKSSKFRQELICGKSIVKWNPVSCEGNYLWLCEECRKQEQGVTK